MAQIFTIDENFKNPALRERLKALQLPASILNNINPKFQLREYQTEAFKRLVFLKEYSHTSDLFSGATFPHLAFNMATGSGKTLIMAGAILYLYSLGYRNFLFFSNGRQIIDKTIDNFTNKASSKYFFNQDIIINNCSVQINTVDNFELSSGEDINICFTSINGLHSQLKEPKENAITLDDLNAHKIVLLGDEAHHFNAGTKQTKKDLLALENWENTINNIFKSNKENILLEFSATFEYSNKDIYEKYKNKVIYKYDLKEFRNDKFSKDIFILQSDLHKKDLILQAIVLNQYKQSIGADYHINFKPVIFFKAVKSIKESKLNQEFFNDILDDLSVDDITKLYKNVMSRDQESKALERAFKYFHKQDSTFNILVALLKANFNMTKQLNVNESNDKRQIKEVKSHEMLLNSLENYNNPIRVIFAVNKLNEGWDVLNLYDIVRLYDDEANATKRTPNTMKKQTVSEAQLIGRGARYFPFIVQDENNENIEYSNIDKYRRKFDDNKDHDLKILENLHYHSIYDSEFIDKLNNELENIGLLDNPNQYMEVEMRLRATPDIDKFLKKDKVITNKKIKKRYDKFNLWSYLSYNENGKNFQYKIPTGAIVENRALTGGDMEIQISNNHTSIEIKHLPYTLKQNALLYNKFFDYDNLKHKFPRIKSIKDFIDEYLDTLTIDFIGGKDDLQAIKDYEPILFTSNKNIEHLSNNITSIKQQLFTSLIFLLNAIEKQLIKYTTKYQGTKYFKQSQGASKNFVSVKKKLKLDNGRQINDMNKDEIKKFTIEVLNQKIVKDMDCFLYQGFTGTSEEIAFVELFKNKIHDELISKGYTNIILARNDEKQPAPVKIFNFDDGMGFCPDFLLFMKNKKTNSVNYQVFIEPKGKNIQELDSWKNAMLKTIQETYRNQGENFKYEDKGQNVTYYIIALPFYNDVNDNQFINELKSTL